MELLNGIALLLVIANFLVSYKGFKDLLFFNRYLFEVDKILIGKQYYRLITSGFLHLNWMHLGFNMFSLYVFSEGLEPYTGTIQFLTIYFVSLLAGDLFALYIHRNHGDYSAVGASGAVCGIIFASIAIFPKIEIGFFGIPPFMPGWLYGIAFVLFSIYGIRNKSGNVGHEAHLGGAIAGMCTALVFYPSALMENYIPIVLILIPVVAFIFLIFMRPHILLIEGYSPDRKKKYHNIEDKYNIERNLKQATIDAILEKISRTGMQSLTKDEREMLDAFSKRRQ